MVMTENSTELELDIQQIKAVINRCVRAYSSTVYNFSRTDKIITSRRNFILFQFRNIFDTGFWL